MGYIIKGREEKDSSLKNGEQELDKNIKLIPYCLGF